MEAVQKQIIIVLVVAAAAAAEVVVVEVVDSMGKFTCVSFFLSMCTEIDVRQVMREKFYIYCSVFFNYLTRTKKYNYFFFRPPRAPTRRRMGGFGGTGGGIEEIILYYKQ
jgi:hypothetical protein